MNTKFGVSHQRGGYSIFNTDNEYIGHMESDSNEGFNLFDIDNNWIGIVK
jgi:hypothetical protein